MALTKIRTSEDVNFDSNISLGNTYKISGAVDPSAAQDYATKNYVDSVAQGLKAKQSVKAATINNITLSGTQTVDGVTLAVNDRVCVKNQSTASQNGIYAVQSGAWTRTTDADTWDELVGAFVFVEQGTTNADTGWLCTADIGGSLGTTSVNFAQFSGAGSYTAGNGITLTGSQFSANLDSAGGLEFNSGAIRAKIADGTLTRGSSGLAVNTITESNIATSVAGKGLVGGGGTALGVNCGDGLEIVSDAVTVTSAVLQKTSIMVREVPSGIINGSNCIFTLSSTPTSGKEMIFKRGLLMNAGSGNDYTISGNTITFTSAPKSGDTILAVYF